MKTKIFTNPRLRLLVVIGIVIVGFSSCAPAYYPYDDYYGYYPNYYYSPGYYGYNYYYPRARHRVFINRRYVAPPRGSGSIGRSGRNSSPVRGR